MPYMGCAYSKYCTSPYGSGKIQLVVIGGLPSLAAGRVGAQHQLPPVLLMNTHHDRSLAYAVARYHVSHLAMTHHKSYTYSQVDGQQYRSAGTYLYHTPNQGY